MRTEPPTECLFSRGTTTAALCCNKSTEVPMEEGLSAFSKLATQTLGERVNHVWKWAREWSHDVVHQHASVIKHKKASETAQCCRFPWNYSWNTWLALVINLNCCHLHFYHLSHTSTVTVHCEGESRLSRGIWKTGCIVHWFLQKITLVFLNGSNWFKLTFKGKWNKSCCVPCCRS